MKNTFEEQLENSIFNLISIATKLYPDKNRISASAIFTKKRKKIEYNKFSTEEKIKIKKIIEEETKKILEIDIKEAP